MKLEITVTKKTYKDEALNDVTTYLKRYNIVATGKKSNLKEDKLYIDTDMVELVEKLPNLFGCKVKQL